MKEKKWSAADVREAVERVLLFAVGSLLAAIFYRIVFWPVTTIVVQMLEIGETLTFWEDGIGRDFELFYLILSAVLILLSALVVPLKRNISFPLLATAYIAFHILHSFHTKDDQQFDAKLLMLGAALSVLFLTRDRRLEPAGFAAAFIAFGAARYLGCPVTELDMETVMMTPFGLLMAYVPACLLGTAFDLPVMKDVLAELGPKWFIPCYLLLVFLRAVIGVAIDLILLPFCLLEKLTAKAPSEHP